MNWPVILSASTRPGSRAGVYSPICLITNPPRTCIRAWQLFSRPLWVIAWKSFNIYVIHRQIYLMCQLNRHKNETGHHLYAKLDLAFLWRKDFLLRVNQLSKVSSLKQQRQGQLLINLKDHRSLAYLEVSNGFLVDGIKHHRRRP